jgi:hypothetical protein
MIVTSQFKKAARQEKADQPEDYTGEHEWIGEHHLRLLLALNIITE